MEKQKLLEIVKQHSDRDAIGIILSNYADYGNSDGPLLSVKQFGRVADVIIEWTSQKSNVNNNKNHG